MRKEAAFFYIIVMLFFLLFSFTLSFAEVEIPQDLANFYAKDISSLTLSNNSLLLYSSDDREIIYYMYYNYFNVTLNITASITCTSDNCPNEEQIIFDYVHEDETLPYVKKAAGIFVLTNNSDLGDFDYNLVISDVSINYSETVPFSVTVISSSFWVQFWHNLLSLF